MTGYYKLEPKFVQQLGNDVRNVENNIYQLVFPLIVQNQKSLPKDLRFLYETLNIPIVSYKFKNSFFYAIDSKQKAYLEEFSKYLMLNVSIEMEEENCLGHLLRVGRYAKELASHIHLREQEVYEIYIAALFHDIGKYLIPKEIIGKKGKLTDDEFRVVQTHCVLARDILGNFLEEKILEMIESHHERIYGTGYPKGIVPSVGAQIIGIADSYDAMVSKRVYHSGKQKAEAYEELLLCTIPKEKGGKGQLYDEKLVKEFIYIQKRKKENDIFSVTYKELG